MSSVRVAIVGVGNCAASLVQGVEYYKDANPEVRVPGLMHVQLGDYHVSDVEFVSVVTFLPARSSTVVMSLLSALTMIAPPEIR